ncbi:hypothetical protein Y032_0008g300 [Ancylostoma ceylanicum]|uniref:E2F/DP family winged-helix DNA-binding domain-containing protein n=1 Tax=Ancylostoma ceylanicum TaxID=53326 RepID=A0A016VKX8_9BILA|nr:hypothetical protein Y032_0008g300 [Ancylostoma ceylanicum]
MPADAIRCHIRETSLVTITKKLMGLKDYRGGVVDLNDAAHILRVPKRRLYDVVNVLQGVGLMERLRRNTVSWMKDSPEDDELLGTLRCKRDALLKEEASLDDALQRLAEAVCSARSEATAYVHLHDLRAIQGLEDQTLIAVTSLPDEVSSVDVGGPTESGLFEMLVKSTGRSPLRGFLCPADFCSFTDVMDLACGDGPSARSPDVSSPSTVIKQEETVIKQEETVIKQEETVIKQEETVIKQEEIDFENEMLDCILETLVHPSKQHSTRHGGLPEEDELHFSARVICYLQLLDIGYHFLHVHILLFHMYRSMKSADEVCKAHIARM